MGTKTYNNYEDLLTFTRASKGHALRPVSYGTELVTNGTFDTDSDWTDASTGDGSSSISGGKITITDANGGVGRAFQNITIKAGSLYEISFEASGTNSIYIVASALGINSGFNSGQTHVLKIVASASDLEFNLYCSGSSGSASIDNLTLKEVLFDQPDGTLTLFEHPDNIPRVEWDANGNRLGLLVEEARTNLVTDSQDFSASSWTKTNTATLALDSVGPDGQANSAVKLIDDSATGTGVVRVFDNVGVSTSTDYTFSVYAKADQLSKVLLFTIGFTNPSNNGYIFDLNDGTYTAYSGTPALTPSVEYVGNGWYRCSITFTTDATDTGGSLAIYAYDTSEAVDLDGTSSILIYGAQFEEGSFPTSYIKTTGATATRSADVASIPVADFGYNQSEGTLFVDFDMKYKESGSLFPRVVEIAKASSNADRIKIQVVENTGVLTAQSYTNFNIQANLNLGARTGGSLDATKVAFAFKENDFAASDNGDTAVTDTTGTFAPSVGRDTLAIGKQANASNNFLNGHIKSIQYYPRRLTNAQLQDLTS